MAYLLKLALSMPAGAPDQIQPGTKTPGQVIKPELEVEEPSLHKLPEDIEGSSAPVIDGHVSKADDESVSSELTAASEATTVLMNALQHAAAESVSQDSDDRLSHLRVSVQNLNPRFISVAKESDSDSKSVVSTYERVTTTREDGSVYAKRVTPSQINTNAKHELNNSSARSVSDTFAEFTHSLQIELMMLDQPDSAEQKKLIREHREIACAMADDNLAQMGVDLDFEKVGSDRDQQIQSLQTNILDISEALKEDDDIMPAGEGDDYYESFLDERTMALLEASGISFGEESVEGKTRFRDLSLDLQFEIATRDYFLTEIEIEPEVVTESTKPEPDPVQKKPIKVNLGKINVPQFIRPKPEPEVKPKPTFPHTTLDPIPEEKSPLEPIPEEDPEPNPVQKKPIKVNLGKINVPQFIHPKPEPEVKPKPTFPHTTLDPIPEEKSPLEPIPEEDPEPVATTKRTAQPAIDFGGVEYDAEVITEGKITEEIITPPPPVKTEETKKTDPPPTIVPTPKVIAPTSPNAKIPTREISSVKYAQNAKKLGSINIAMNMLMKTEGTDKREKINQLMQNSPLKENAETRLEELDNRSADLYTAKTELRNEKEALQAEKETLTTEQQPRREEIGSQKKQLEGRRQELLDRGRSKERLSESEKADVKAEIDGINVTLQELDQEVATLDADIAVIETKEKDLEKIEVALQKQDWQIEEETFDLLEQLMIHSDDPNDEQFLNTMEFLSLAVYDGIPEVTLEDSKNEIKAGQFRFIHDRNGVTEKEAKHARHEFMLSFTKNFNTLLQPDAHSVNARLDSGNFNSDNLQLLMKIHQSFTKKEPTLLSKEEIGKNTVFSTNKGDRFNPQPHVISFEKVTKEIKTLEKKEAELENTMEKLDKEAAVISTHIEDLEAKLEQDIKPLTREADVKLKDNEDKQAQTTTNMETKNIALAENNATLTEQIESQKQTIQDLKAELRSIKGNDQKATKAKQAIQKKIDAATKILNEATTKRTLNNEQLTKNTKELKAQLATLAKAKLAITSQRDKAIAELKTKTKNEIKDKTQKKGMKLQQHAAAEKELRLLNKNKHSLQTRQATNQLVMDTFNVKSTHVTERVAQKKPDPPTQAQEVRKKDTQRHVDNSRTGISKKPAPKAPTTAKEPSLGTTSRATKRQGNALNKLQKQKEKATAEQHKIASRNKALARQARAVGAAHGKGGRQR